MFCIMCWAYNLCPGTCGVIKCSDESVLINVILPHSIHIESPFFVRERTSNIDGKQVDFNGMIIVIVKCFDYNWTD